MLHNTAASLSAVAEENGEGDPVSDSQDSLLPQMECQPFENHDYIMLMFHNSQDFHQGCERLGITKVQIEYPGGLRKVGIGRCIDGAKAIARLTGGGL